MKTLHEYAAQGIDISIRLHRRADGTHTVSKKINKRLEFKEFAAKKEAKAYYDQLVSTTTKGK
jgi:hypothetical protein